MIALQQKRKQKNQREKENIIIKVKKMFKKNYKNNYFITIYIYING